MGYIKNRGCSICSSYSNSISRMAVPITGPEPPKKRGKPELREMIDKSLPQPAAVAKLEIHFGRGALAFCYFYINWNSFVRVSYAF